MTVAGSGDPLMLVPVTGQKSNTRKGTRTIPGDIKFILTFLFCSLYFRPTPMKNMHLAKAVSQNLKDGKQHGNQVASMCWLSYTFTHLKLFLDLMILERALYHQEQLGLSCDYACRTVIVSLNRSVKGSLY